MVVHNLSQMAEDLKQWEIETDLINEVARLQLQLQAAEKRLQAQRAKTTNMGPRVTQIHNKIDEGRNECTQLSRLCQGIGSKVMGPAYKYSIHICTRTYIFSIVIYSIYQIFYSRLLNSICTSTRFDNEYKEKNCWYYY